LYVVSFTYLFGTFNNKILTLKGLTTHEQLRMYLGVDMNKKVVVAVIVQNLSRYPTTLRRPFLKQLIASIAISRRYNYAGFPNWRKPPLVFMRMRKLRYWKTQEQATNTSLNNVVFVFDCYICLSVLQFQCHIFRS